MFSIDSMVDTTMVLVSTLNHHLFVIFSIINHPAGTPHIWYLPLDHENHPGPIPFHSVPQTQPCQGVAVAQGIQNALRGQTCFVDKENKVCLSIF